MSNVYFPAVEQTTEGISYLVNVSLQPQNGNKLFLDVKNMEPQAVQNELLDTKSHLYPFSFLREKCETESLLIKIDVEHWVGQSSALAVWLLSHYDFNNLSNNNHPIVATSGFSIKGSKVVPIPLLTGEYTEEQWQLLMKKVISAFDIDAKLLILQEDKEALLAHQVLNSEEVCWWGNYLDKNGIERHRQYLLEKYIRNTERVITLNLSDDFLEYSRIELGKKLGLISESTHTFSDLYNLAVPKELDLDPEAHQEYEKIRNNLLNSDRAKEVLQVLPGSLYQQVISEPKKFFEFNNAIDRARHLIVSGPTSSGKTELALLLMINRLIHSINDHTNVNKALYIGPIKALVEEISDKIEFQYGELINWLANYVGEENLGCVLSTGDDKSNDWRYANNSHSKSFALGVTVNEKANLFSNLPKSFIESLSCVVIDEIHMINTVGRARLESFIAKLRQESVERTEADKSPLCIIVLTTEPNSFQQSFEVTNRFSFQAEPLILHTEKRPIPAKHHLLLFKNGNTDSPPQQFHPVLLANSGNEDKFRKLTIKELKDTLHEGLKSCDNISLNSNTKTKKPNVILNKVAAIDYLLSRESKYSSLLVVCNSKNASESIGKELSVSLNFTRKKLPKELLSDFILKVEASDLPFKRKQDLLALCEKGIFLHNSSIDKSIRNEVQKLLRNQSLSSQSSPLIVIATETLSYGVNLNTDTVLFADCKFPRNSGNEEYLNAYEYHNIAGRAGRLNLSEKADVYILQSINSLTEKQKNTNSHHANNGAFFGFLAAIFCDKSEFDKQSKSRNVPANSGKLSSLSSGYLTLVPSFYGDCSGVEDFNEVCRQGQAFDYNNVLHSVLDAILYWEVTTQSTDGVGMPSVFDNVIFYSLFFSNNKQLNSSFSKTPESCFHLPWEVNRRNLIDNFERVLSYKKFKPLNLFTQKNNDKYKVTHAGVSLISHGTHFETANDFEYWIRLMTKVFNKRTEPVYAELLIPALCFPFEIFKSYKLECPEILCFRDQPIQESNWQSIAELLLQEQEALFKKHYKGDAEQLSVCIDFALSSGIIKDIGSGAEGENIYKSSAGQGFLMPFQSTNKNKLKDEPIKNKLFNKVIFLRIINLVYSWMNGESREELENALQFSPAVIKKLDDLGESAKNLKSKAVGNLGRGRWDPESGIHNQLVYKSNTLINFFTGRERFAAYNILENINFSVDVFERRIKYGCKQELIPIASALGTEFDRSSKRNGYHDLYNIACGIPLELDNFIEEKLKKHFFTTFLALKSVVARNMDGNGDFYNELNDFWEALSNFMALFDPKSSSSITSSRKRLVEELNTSLQKLILVSNWPSKQLPIDSFDHNSGKVSIFSFVILVTLVHRRLLNSMISISDIYDYLEKFDKNIGMTDVISYPHWDQMNDIFIELKRACYSFDDPVNPRY